MSVWWVCVLPHGVRLCPDCGGEERWHWKMVALAVCMYVSSFPKICRLLERGKYSRHNTRKKADASLQAARIQECTLHLADSSHYMSLINSAY